MFSGFSSAPGGFQFFYILIAAVVIGGFIYAIASGTKTWISNNNSPILTVDAVIVAKREDVSVHRHDNAGDATGAHGFHTTSSTTYYVTFELENGERKELHVSGKEYGLLAEGDSGKLTFQGTRYKGFERTISRAETAQHESIQEVKYRQE